MKIVVLSCRRDLINILVTLALYTASILPRSCWYLVIPALYINNRNLFPFVSDVLVRIIRPPIVSVFYTMSGSVVQNTADECRMTSLLSYILSFVMVFICILSVFSISHIELSKLFWPVLSTFSWASTTVTENCRSKTESSGYWNGTRS